MYNKSTFTYGFEIEWGDIDRNLTIPSELGFWDYSETTIINKNGKYWGIATDPLGIDPPFGGEINTIPSKTIEDQVNKIMKIYDFFKENGCSPTVSCGSDNHIHVRIPGLRNDIESLKKLILYIKNNQHDVYEKVSKFIFDKRMTSIKNCKNQLSGNFLMPDWRCDNIINLAKDFDDFIRLHCCGKDGISMGRPLRYLINTYSLKHVDTVEFRCFRGSINEKEIRDSFDFVELFLDSALNGGKSVNEILEENNFKFPDFIFDYDLFLSWTKTKYDKSRGKKERRLIKI